jgi:transposase
MPQIKGSKTLAASPELLDRPRRRTFTAQDKLRILGEADRAAGVPGGIGAIVRREGLYSSALSDWRRQRAAGAFEALSPAKRGPKTAEPNPLAAELALSQQDNLRLKKRLERAEAIIELQKKWRPCWVSQSRATRGLDGRRVGFGAGRRLDRRRLHSAWAVARQPSSPAGFSETAPRGYTAAANADAGARCERAPNRPRSIEGAAVCRFGPSRSAVASSIGTIRIITMRASAWCQVHYGQADEVYAARQQILDRAFQSKPERFVKKPPEPPLKPTAAWINPPTQGLQIQA